MPRRTGLTPASAPEKSGTILQFKVWLLGLSPLMWRRVHAPAAFTLRQLHGVIQVAMGWEGIHLFQFHLRAIRYGSWEVSARSPEVTLESLRLRRGARFAYEYDLNIPWRHEIRLEERLEPLPKRAYPFCADGHEACPPEDCGGPPGYPISYRQLEEMMEERGVDVDHSTLNRWVVKYAPELDRRFRSRKRQVGSSWRLDETYVKIRGSWKYLYRAVDKAGATVDFLLTAKRDRKAALRFLRRAIGQNGAPKKITIDKSGANTAAIESYNAEHTADIEIRRRKYLNNIVEQDHRAIKRVARPMLGFKCFRSAAATLAGVELMHMIRKGQLRTTGKLCPAKQFYALAA